jgi:chorismate mutase
LIVPSRHTVDEQDDVAGIRRAIDETDDEILHSIEMRLELARRMAWAKKSVPACSPLRPKRESFILDRLKRSARSASAMLIEIVWRELIGQGRQAQAPMTLVLLRSPDALLVEECARRHFSSAIAVEWAGTREAALTAARDGPAVAVLNSEEDEAELTCLGPVKTLAGRVVGFAYARVSPEEEGR